jgi:hypothetical protein
LNSSRIAKVSSIVVGATATVVIVALIEAGCWVAFHDGFGMGDLYALSFWSLPFGAVVAMAGVVLRSAERPKARALRVLGATAVGALLGLLWTVLMMQMMGPWFGMLSFPVLPILATSGALTLAVFVSYLPKSVIIPSR